MHFEIIPSELLPVLQQYSVIWYRVEYLVTWTVLNLKINDPEYLKFTIRCMQKIFMGSNLLTLGRQIILFQRIIYWISPP